MICYYEKNLVKKQLQKFFSYLIACEIYHKWQV